MRKHPPPTHHHTEFLVNTRESPLPHRGRKVAKVTAHRQKPRPQAKPAPPGKGGADEKVLCYFTITMHLLTGNKSL